MDEAETRRWEESEKRLKETAALILPTEEKLRALPKEQIEHLVIWLKSIHNPPDPEDRDRDVYFAFYNRVAELRNISEQVALQRKAMNKCRVCIGSGIIIGILVLIAAIVGIAETNWFIPIIAAITIFFVYKKGLKYAVDAILISKEQEQRHLWRCIREAKNVPQLQAAGLYAFIKNEEFDTHTQQMRDAIYCNGSDRQRLAEALEALRG